MDGAVSAGAWLFDRLTIGQAFVMHAANLYHHAAQRACYIGASQETLESGGFMGGELLWFADEANEALNEMVSAEHGIRRAA